MIKNQPPVIETERLFVRAATRTDIDFFYKLWTDPQVMVHVGFPEGLRLNLEEMKAKKLEQEDSEFDQVLVIEYKGTGNAIGECKLSRPNDKGISEPDIKLLPAYWGQGYGSEIWAALVNYQFIHTDCDTVQTTPHVDNIAAIRMYEASGAVREGEDVYHFPKSMQDYTTPVHCFIYRLYRADWQKRSARV